MENFGERQSNTQHDWGYFAHLSIYDFAKQFIRAGRVLDIGCGTGYGLAHLSRETKAAVYGIERDPDVVKMLCGMIPKAIINECDLEEGKLDYPDRHFEMVFSSNVFEHIINIDPLLAECRRVIDDNGIFVLAVPPITTVGQLRENAKNIFHVNNLPEDVWESKLLRYFARVKRIRHWVTPERIANGEIVKSTSDLSDFTFDERNPNDHSITAIFVSESPREKPLSSSYERSIPQSWRKELVEARARIEVFTSLMSELTCSPEIPPRDS